MERFGIFILIWGLCIIIYRTYIQLNTFRKYKFLIAELSIDRLLLFIPEITPLKELRQSENPYVSKIYKIIRIYKYIFWIGFFIALTVLLFH